MKKLICFFLFLSLLLVGCASPEERKFNSMVNELLYSDVYENLLWVAECDNVTSGQLEICASKCADIGKQKNELYDTNQGFRLACEIATGLVNHPNTTESVVRRLMNSNYYDIWAITASAECNTEGTLFEMAKNVHELQTSDLL